MRTNRRFTPEKQKKEIIIIMGGELQVQLQVNVK